MRAEDWVSVKERLPNEHGQRVIVAYKFGVGENFYFGDGRFVKGLLSQVEIPGVTHWMPLPEPPKDLTTSNLVGSELSIKETV